MNFALRANTKAGWNFDVDLIQPVQLAEYLPGGHYTWHTDTFVTEVDELNTQRKLSVVALLSSPDDYEGGGLELNRKNTNVMPNGQGSVYVFPSILEHRVVPVTSGVRYSLTGWCRGPAFR
jgi:PKHD-type hydroxylase